MNIREREIAHAILEVIDFSDNGISMLKIEEVLGCGISFRQMVLAVNDLYDKKLISLDANHVARRVKS